MTDYVAVCEGATSAPTVGAGTFEASCASASGTVVYVPETAWGLPELTLEDGGLIAAAVLALWALAWAYRVIARMIEDS